MLDSPSGSILFLHKSLNVLENSFSWPEKRKRSISCHHALFARWNGTEQLPILAGLYEDEVQGSRQKELMSDHDRQRCTLRRWQFLFDKGTC
jgi:hypothetical protein